MEHTASHEYLISIISSVILFFSIAGVVVPLLNRFKLSSVLAYLICGIFIGPYGIGRFVDSFPMLEYFSIEDPEVVHTLGELGIISLMFMIGLELSLDRLKELKKLIFGLGTSQILITGAVVFLIALLFNNSLQSSILLGASFALSSTAIVMKLLEEKKLASKPVGVLCFSVLLMQDLAVVPILVLASSFTGDTETSIIFALTKSIVLGIVTVIGIYCLGKKVITPLLRTVSFSKTPEWLSAFIVFMVLSFSLLTYSAGLSLALGAFMAGLLISETEFKHEVEVIINPVKGLLLGIFFLSIGMMINLVDIMQNPILLPISVIGIYIIKAIIIFVLCSAFKLPGRISGEASIYLAQPGEFALMILGVAMSSELMPTSDVQFFLLVTALAMMATPLLFKLSKRAGYYGDKLRSDKSFDLSSSPIGEDHKVIVAGFGRVGHIIADVLEEKMIPYLAFESNGKTVQKYSKENYSVIYGDAKKKEIWHKLIHDKIEVAVIAIDDNKASKMILRSLRAEFPLLPVIVRSKDHYGMNSLYEEGATEVVAETLESSKKIADLLMSKLSLEYN